MGEGDRKSGIGGAYIFSDGSLLESGNVGGGAFIVGSRGAEAESGMWQRCGMVRLPAWLAVWLG